MAALLNKQNLQRIGSNSARPITAANVRKPVLSTGARTSQVAHASGNQAVARVDLNNGTLVVGGPSSSAGAAETEATSMRILSPDSKEYQEIAALWDKWNKALKEGGTRFTKNEFGNGAEVVKCFADDAAVLPTLSDELKKGSEDIRDYFDRAGGVGTSFLAKNPVGKMVPGQRVIRMMGPDVAVDQGLYVFEVDASADPDPTKRPRAKALGRFTYVYKRKDGEWKIHLFHSSQQPDYVAERGLVEQHLQRWLNTIFSKDALVGGESLESIEERAQRTADLYAPDGILLATVSPLIRMGRKDIVDYMRYFVSLNPKGEVMKDEQGNKIQDIKLLDANTTSIAGIYKFEANDGKGGRQNLMARFSFTYVRNEAGDWKIAEHHSSALPSVGELKNGKSIKSPLAAKDLVHMDMVDFP